MKVRPTSTKPLELVAIGHVTVDRLGTETRLGGSAAYAALAASRLGVNAAIVTSVGADFPFWSSLGELEAHFSEADRTTTFENIYDASGRRQRVLALAAPIREPDLAAVSGRLAEDAAVLYCPVAQEIEAPLVPLAPRGLCGVAPQGFYRRIAPSGDVSLRDWTNAEGALARADFVSVSEKDAIAPEELAERFGGKAFAITRGARGVRVHAGADVLDLPAFTVQEVDPTGAGDVFAASFLLALREERPLAEAAQFATCAASFTVENIGPSRLGSRSEVEARLLDYLERLRSTGNVPR